jgi:glycosyltransferase involved in cell wall biosynthesis
MNKPFSLVSTVFNEINRLDQTIAEISSQTLQPAEIIVTDAGSTDGTYELLLRWQATSKVPIVVLQKHRCNVAEGRNMAIKAAKHELIASTDFGCRFEPDWLENLMAPFAEADTKIVAGAFTVQEHEINTLAGKADYILANGYPVDLGQYFVPSSRSIAYYREVWEKVGGYPEWLTLTADDSTFALVVVKEGYTFKFAHKPCVYWGRHKTFLGFQKEFLRYGLGEGEAHCNLRNFFSNLVETSCRYTLPISIILAVISLLPLWLLAPVMLVQLFGLRSYKNAFKNWLNVKSDKYDFGAFLAALYMVEQSRFYHMKGYIRGYWFSNELRTREGIKLQERLNK